MCLTLLSNVNSDDLNEYFSLFLLTALLKGKFSNLFDRRKKQRVLNCTLRTKHYHLQEEVLSFVVNVIMAAYESQWRDVDNLFPVSENFPEDFLT